MPDHYQKFKPILKGGSIHQLITLTLSYRTIVVFCHHELLPTLNRKSCYYVMAMGV